MEAIRSRVEAEIELIQEFANELKWVERGLTGWRGTDPDADRARELEALQKLRESRFAPLLERYNIILPDESELKR